MPDIRLPLDGDKTSSSDRSLKFSYTQQLGFSGSPVRSEATSRASGKVILVGEHAVVYGARAIAVPLLSRNISLRMYTDRVATTAPRIKFQIGGHPAQDQLVQMVNDAFDVLGVPKFNLSIDARSTLIIGAGIGSSASICVGVLRGMAQVCGMVLTPVALAELANKLERRFHGTPSGLDTAVISLEHAILFERGRFAEALIVNKPKDSNLPWCFALLDTGVRSPTIDMVYRAKPWFEAQGSAVIDQFNDITANAASALMDGDLTRMAESMNRNHELLASAGVVTQPVTDVIELALKNGAIAAKVTGAGGGGCVLALFPAENCDRGISAVRKTIGNDRTLPLFLP
jgi:mevalonate kinase